MRRRERRELLDRRFGDESVQREVAAMHLEEHPRGGPDRALVIGEMRAIRGAHLAQERAALRHDLVHAEAAADLDQLAAREECLAAVGHRVEGEDERRRAVVDDERVLGAGELAEQRRAVHVARAACAALEIELEIGVSGRDGGYSIERGVGERSAA